MNLFLFRLLTSINKAILQLERPYQLPVLSDMIFSKLLLLFASNVPRELQVSEEETEDYPHK